MGIEDKVSYWLDGAQYDLEAAEVMLRGEKYLYVGFLCHQVIEKVLKAYYWSEKKTNPPYTHNLSFLAKESGLHERFSDEQRDFLDFLEPLNIEARYPTHKEKLHQTLSRDVCTKLLAKTNEMAQWIKTQLSQK